MPDVLMPRLSDTMTEGILTTWIKHEGDMVAHGDVLAEIETDKAVMELESYESGVLSRILVPEGTTVPIGQPIAVIGADSATETDAAAAPASAGAPASSPADSSVSTASSQPAPASPDVAEPTAARAGADAARVRATPLVRRLAREHDIDLGTVTGTGPDGRIVRADLEALLEQPPPAAPPMAADKAPAPAPAADASVVPAAVADEKVPLSTIRRITAQRLTESAAVPHFHLTTAVDVGPLLELRAALNTQVFTGGMRCTVTDLLVRAVAVTLATHRGVNASWGGDHVLRHGQINVGVAVALDDGLIVPVVRDADRKTITQIAEEARALTEKARAGKLTLDEFAGGTFTISNLGTYGIEHFTAVINPPEAAILAVGAARDEPVVRDGNVEVRTMMRMTLTSDHRVLDGAVSAAFLRDLVAVLAEPLRLLA